MYLLYYKIIYNYLNLLRDWEKFNFVYFVLNNN